MNRASDGFSGIVVELEEWDRLGPADNTRLKGLSLGNDPAVHRLIESLHDRVSISNGFQGPEIVTTSFVGRVDVGPLSIAVKPKLPAMPLARLLHYAYGLQSLSVFDETQVPITSGGFHDLLVSLLAAEIEELFQRGLARRYMPLPENLNRPRGRILIDKIIRRGGMIDSQLPCLHFDRKSNWQLNQVILAGLELAGRIATDRDLRYRVQRLAALLTDVTRLPRLGVADIDHADGNLNRLTENAAPVLTIIRLLHDIQGVEFDSSNRKTRMPGFLFDMNIFFQRLLSRFLHQYLRSARVADERTIKKMFAFAPEGNPRGRSVPAPRPDFALSRENKLFVYLDAKYRDIWNKSLPREWLYQLSIYALASPTNVSVILYAAMSEDARDEFLEVFQPELSTSKVIGSVIIRPVNLPYLASILEGGTDKLVAERSHYAEALCALRPRSMPKKLVAA